ncbi:hypothetical protein M514_07391 [Trichuris suis]|uniref:Uncharacterized protein n=1 Tax=Trichuris suis TaxID=68888 RepID=A0A085NC81_9BILA|nr:hypothetical protein M513_07391 [Trichuris suis]KFD67077.1 hypothetical protein M514_07391 [Trichuris suis]
MMTAAAQRAPLGAVDFFGPNYSTPSRRHLSKVYYEKGACAYVEANCGRLGIGCFVVGEPQPYDEHFVIFAVTAAAAIHHVRSFRDDSVFAMPFRTCSTTMRQLWAVCTARVESSARDLDQWASLYNGNPILSAKGLIRWHTSSA